MKSSQILREAARLVESGEEPFSCWAIILAAGIPHNNFFSAIQPTLLAHPAGAAYAALLGRLPTVGDFGWYQESDDRVLALCLAAAIAESEGD